MRAAYPNQLDYAGVIHVNALSSRICTLHTNPYHGGVAQMVERSLSMREAQGSIPCSSTFFVTCYQACSKPDFEFETPGTMSSINASGADTTKNCLCSRRKQKETKDGTEGSPRLSHSPGTTRTSGKIKRCLDRGSNTGPLDLQSNALPTELSKQLHGG